MDHRYRDIFAKHVLSITSLSEQQNPKAALIVRGGVLLGCGFSKSTGTENDTSPIFESIQEYYAMKGTCSSIDKSAIFCTYFPNIEEFTALYSTDIRTVYYMGDIVGENTVRFLNNCSGDGFEIIKLEVS
jgi:hypothetical protein